MNTFLIYLISVLSDIESFFSFVLTLSGIIVAILFLGYVSATINPKEALILDTKDKRETALNAAKVAMVICIISVITCIFIPSEEHMIAMLLSSYATTDNFNAAVEQLKNAVLFLKENGVL